MVVSHPSNWTTPSITNVFWRPAPFLEPPFLRKIVLSDFLSRFFDTLGQNLYKNYTKEYSSPINKTDNSLSTSTQLSGTLMKAQTSSIGVLRGLRMWRLATWYINQITIRLLKHVVMWTMWGHLLLLKMGHIHFGTSENEAKTEQRNCSPEDFMWILNIKEKTEILAGTRSRRIPKVCRRRILNVF